MEKLKNVKVVERSFTDENGDSINYYRVVLQVGKTSIELKPVDKKSIQLLIDLGLIDFESEVE